MSRFRSNLMRIDAHQHFWSLARGDYGWLTPALGALKAKARTLPALLDRALRQQAGTRDMQD